VGGGFAETTSALKRTIKKRKIRKRIKSKSKRKIRIRKLAEGVTSLGSGLEDR
jgi:hypothetical protein